ncbi:uncharacterized protein LOC125709115 [Brienomyrus brachyistius]|uniref:uncharacterized protein LOC125709115 n=1 Tax=Brienomyrus brachyistius TaxID=42636 RepID=UPI0020B3268B|nr:uncharacterized protein LOC125709115 [Brienomyrus brachyistius]XP_048833173.1 uncharacterized protein LOC125709115 [Brienomyrus brachyistius]XP_048833174.1 uncharacterized protein LOC125709115 [Brienomyrus brachyistius]
MDEELRQLREQVARLEAENEWLQQERVVDRPSGSTSGQSNLRGVSLAAGAMAPGVERVVLFSRDRKCPMFRGRLGLSIYEWVEEVQACIRARQIALADQALFMMDHLEGEAREEIKYRPREDRENPERIIAILQELYGCKQSYVALQEAFFSRRQQEGEGLQEFSLALLSLMGKVTQAAPGAVPNAEVLLRDQFIEYVRDGALRRELKRFVRHQPTATLLDARSEAIRWEREGTPSVTRGRSYSFPEVSGIQYGVHGASVNSPSRSWVADLGELKELVKRQQDQLSQLAQNLQALQSQHGHSSSRAQVICRRCHQPGHYARECERERVPPRPVRPGDARTQGPKQSEN